MNEVSIVIVMSIAAILWAAITYSVGYKEGERVGFARGRAVTRHATSIERSIYAIPADVKEVK